MNISEPALGDGKINTTRLDAFVYKSWGPRVFGLQMYGAQAEVIYQLTVCPSFWMNHPEFLLKIRVSGFSGWKCF